MDTYTLPNDFLSALTLLYGQSKEPILICNRQMDLLWQSAERAKKLHLPLLMQLQSSTNGQLLLPDSCLIPVSADNTMYRCHISEICAGDGDPLLLCRFYEQAESRETNLEEYRAILSAYNAELRSAASELVSVCELIHRSEPACQTVAINAIQQLNNACYHLLNQSARCKELLWYDNSTAEQLDALPVVDLRPVLERTLSQIKQLTADFMVVQPASPFEPIPAQIDPERFEVALLLLFTQLQAGNQARTVLSCDTVRTGNELVLTISLSSLGDACCDRLHKPLCHEDAAAASSASCLLNRFSNAFHVQITYSNAEDSVSASFHIPLRTSGLMPLHFATETPSNDGRFSRAHQFLSEILDFQPLW